MSFMVPRQRIPKFEYKNTNSRSYSSNPGFLDTEAGRLALIVTGSAVCISVFAYQGYMFFFGPATIYPKEVQKLLRKGGESYLQIGEKRDLELAAKYYTEALEIMDNIATENEKGSTASGSGKFSSMKRDDNRITGIEARVAEIYSTSGDYEKALYYLEDLVSRIFTAEELAEYTLVVEKLVNSSSAYTKKKSAKIQGELEKYMRGIGAINKLAETYEKLGDESKYKGTIFNNDNFDYLSDYNNAETRYTFCLNTVLGAYSKYYSTTYQPSNGSEMSEITKLFDPKTLPKFLSAYTLTSLLYNCSNFFSKIEKYDFAYPLLIRSLDLLKPSVDSKKESESCKSCVLMTHLTNIAILRNDLSDAQIWIDNGLSLSKEYPTNPDCIHSSISLIYDQGHIFEALEASKMADYRPGQINASDALSRISN
ncbi:hypothetical protein AX774_g4565 [Zancudomyces culisetae]|uniref:Uncharacterized protein n=1 Tax=Zancudomyces culisetae TaxID=1213189 RepID=A0A1R1PLW8_ZANCU|nr:hypothetical protein AX774_g4565 [Zancudomyces culisetae]|eukprot:OMH81968.1 hypothetical protein AX774_g4565 [Zancudomyces culisetae]